MFVFDKKKKEFVERGFGILKLNEKINSANESRLSKKKTFGFIEWRHSNCFQELQRQDKTPIDENKVKQWRWNGCARKMFTSVWKILVERIWERESPWDERMSRNIDQNE